MLTVDSHTKNATGLSLRTNHMPPATGLNRASGVIGDNDLRAPTAPSRIMLLAQDWHTSAYVVAALHDAGIETMLLSTGRPDRLGLGRYCEQVQSPRPDSPDFVPFLHEQVARFRPDLLIALTERLIELLWSLNPPPVPIYPPTEEWQREAITDRRAFYRCAAAAGVPIAPWMVVNGPEDLAGAARRLGLPLVLRGTAGCAGTQVKIAGSMAEAHAAYETLQRVSPGTPFAQAYADGERQLFGGVFLRGETLRSSGQVTLERWPRETSPSIRVRTIHDMTMEAYTQALMRRLRWTGMACAEYIRTKNGELILLEVNARPWAALRAHERCGADLCRAFAEMVAGRAPAPRSTCRTGVESLLLHGFVTARRRGTIWRTFRRIPLRDLYLCLRAVPWRRAGLTLHTLRSVYRICS